MVVMAVQGAVVVGVWGVVGSFQTGSPQAVENLVDIVLSLIHI